MTVRWHAAFAGLIAMLATTGPRAQADSNAGDLLLYRALKTIWTSELRENELYDGASEQVSLTPCQDVIDLVGGADSQNGMREDLSQAAYEVAFIKVQLGQHFQETDWKPTLIDFEDTLFRSVINYQVELDGTLFDPGIGFPDGVRDGLAAELNVAAGKQSLAARVTAGKARCGGAPVVKFLSLTSPNGGRIYYISDTYKRHCDGGLDTPGLCTWSSYPGGRIMLSGPTWFRVEQGPERLIDIGELEDEEFLDIGVE